MTEGSKGGTDVLVNSHDGLICRKKVGGSQRIPLLTKERKDTMILKKDYEATFKEGFRLGMRKSRATSLYAQAEDSRRLGDKQMADFYLQCAQEWTKLARNSGRKFTPSVAHEPEQPAFDFGDPEHLVTHEPFERTGS